MSEGGADRGRHLGVGSALEKNSILGTVDVCSSCCGINKQCGGCWVAFRFERKPRLIH
jgi:hypothetical protein